MTDDDNGTEINNFDDYADNDNEDDNDDGEGGKTFHSQLPLNTQYILVEVINHTILKHQLIVKLRT